MHLRRVAILLIFTFQIISSDPGKLYPESENIALEDFNKTGDVFFREWRNMDSSESPWQEYYLLTENGKKFLRASTERNTSLSIQIGKAMNNYWDIFTYPVLSWEWRIYSVPENGNESRSSRNDSAAGLYVLFQRKKVPLLGARYQPVNWIKYVWSSTLPVGTVIPRKKEKSGIVLYDGRYVVVASGKKNLGKWISLRRDVIADYIRFFGTRPSANPVMIAILTDSDKSRSKAIADYADIRAWKY